jgi:hypothetical protein
MAVDWAAHLPADQRFWGPRLGPVAIVLWRTTTAAEVALLRGWCARVPGPLVGVSEHACRALDLPGPPAPWPDAELLLRAVWPAWPRLAPDLRARYLGRAGHLRSAALVLWRTTRVLHDPWAVLATQLSVPVLAWSQPADAPRVLAQAEAERWVRSWS